MADLFFPNADLARDIGASARTRRWGGISHKGLNIEIIELWLGLLEGKNVNLRLIEKEDLPQLADWANNPEFIGENSWPLQQSKTDWEKRYENLDSDTKWFFILKKDGTRIGTIFHWPNGDLMEIGYVLIPSERRKGYCTEAAKIIVDYLFLSRDLVRIQALTGARNMASQKVLQKAGFKKEATVRKSVFSRGGWRDRYLYSILREEWKEPGTLSALGNQ